MARYGRFYDEDEEEKVKSSQPSTSSTTQTNYGRFQAMPESEVKQELEVKQEPVKEDVAPLAQQPVKQEPVKQVKQKPKNKIYGAINNAISFATGKMQEWGFVGESRGVVSKEKEKSLQQKDFEMTSGFSGENIPVVRNEMLKTNARDHIEYLDKVQKEVEELKQDNTLYLAKKRKELKESGQEFDARQLLEYKQKRLKEIALEMGYFSKEGLKAEDIKDITFKDVQAEGLLSFIKEDKYLAQQNITLNDEVLGKVPVDKNVWNQIGKAVKSKTYLPSLLKGREAEFQEDYLLAMEAIQQGASVGQLTPNQRSAIIRQTNKDWENMVDRGLLAEAPQGLSDMTGYMVDLAIATVLSGGSPLIAGGVEQITSLPKTVQRVRANTEDQFTFIPIDDKDGFRIMTTKLGTEDDMKGTVSALAGGYIETAVELLLGEGVDKLLGAGGTKLASSGVGKKVLEAPITKKLGESFIVKSISKVDNFLKNSPTAKFILQSTGLDSIAGEIAEELVQDMTNSITSGDEYEISTDYIADVASYTAILTFIAGGATRLGGAMTDAQTQAFVNEVNDNKQAYGLPENAELQTDGTVIDVETKEDITQQVQSGELQQQVTQEEDGGTVQEEIGKQDTPVLEADIAKVEESITQTEGEVEDVLFEYNDTTKEYFSDEFKGKAEVLEAIDDIGGVDNVQRETVGITKLEATETFDIANEGVQRVMEEIKSGIKVPLIASRLENGNYLIQDGNHRLVAYKELGITEVPIITEKVAEVRQQQQPKAKETPVKIEAQRFYRGEDGSNKGGNFYTRDKEFANEFIGTGKLSEVYIEEKDIYRPKELAYAGREAEVTEAINKAKELGYKAVYLSEGKPFGEPIESVFVFDKTGIKTRQDLEGKEGKTKTKEELKAIADEGLKKIAELSPKTQKEQVKKEKKEVKKEDKEPTKKKEEPVKEKEKASKEVKKVSMEDVRKEAKEYPRASNFAYIANRKYGMSTEQATEIWNEVNKKKAKASKEVKVESAEEYVRANLPEYKGLKIKGKGAGAIINELDSWFRYLNDAPLNAYEELTGRAKNSKTRINASQVADNIAQVSRELSEKYGKQTVGVQTDRMAMLESKAQAEYEKSWDKLTPQQQYKVLMGLMEGERYIKTTDQDTLVKLGKGVGIMSSKDFTERNIDVLLYKGLEEKMYTDGMILITDSKVANQLNRKFIETTVKASAKSWGVSEEEATKKIKEEIKDKDFPATKDILDSAKANHKLTPIGFYTDGSIRQTGSIIFRAENGTLVRISGKYYSAIKSFYPSAEFYITDESNVKPISFVVGKTRKGIVMPMVMADDTTFANLVGKKAVEESKRAMMDVAEREQQDRLLEKSKAFTREGMMDEMINSIASYIEEDIPIEKMVSIDGTIGYSGEGTWKYNNKTKVITVSMFDGRTVKIPMKEARDYVQAYLDEKNNRKTDDDDIAFYTTARRRGQRGYGKVAKSVDNDNKLIAEAKKYKNAEEFVKAQEKPHYISIEDIKSSFDADTFSNLKGTPRNQNINLLNEYKSTVKRVEKSPIGREITKPISVEFNVDGGNGYRIVDGNHRYLQALKNGDKRILAKFDTLKGTSQERKNIFQEKTKSQLTDIWNKANQATVEQSLIQEAKKYKNAEEFVKAQGEVLYHGTPFKFSDFKKGKTTFFTPDRKFAEDYGYDKSFARELDADIQVLERYGKLNIFDSKNKDHVRKIKDLLPKEIDVMGAMAGMGARISKAEFLERIQGIFTHKTPKFAEEATKVGEIFNDMSIKNEGYWRIKEIKKNSVIAEKIENPYYAKDKQNLKVYRIEEFPRFGTYKEYGEPYWKDFEGDQAFEDVLKKAGFDGYKMTEKDSVTYGIFNPEKLLSKSQLIDIWNKAQQSTSDDQLMLGGGVINPQVSTFKDSVVQKTVYHGTNSKFDKFSYEFMGTTGTADGYGFYFTDKQSIAEMYIDEGKGRLVKARINIQKPLSNDSITMTKAEVGKLIRKLDPTGDDILANFGDYQREGYDNILNKAVEQEFEYNENDVDLVHDIMNIIGRDPERFYPVLTELLGYDGIVNERTDTDTNEKFSIYVVFSNEQIMQEQEVDNSLLNEAGKYDSAEEFIKAIDNQGNTKYWTPTVGLKTKTGEPVLLRAYHGTTKQFDNFIIPEGGVRYTGDGVYFFPAKTAAENYISGQKNGRVVESYLDLRNPYNLNLPHGNIDYQPSNIELEEIKSKKHDSIIVRTGVGTQDDIINEIVVFNTDSIMTKEQLIDIWNKAQSETLKAKEDESKGSQSLETYEAREVTQAEQLKMSDEVKALVHKYADKVGEKYLPRGVLGVFYGKTKEIRLKGITDLYVASHEISHAIDKKYDITARITPRDSVDMQLREAYINLYPTAKETHAVKTQKLEGFAMAVATYLQRPSSFTQEYPVIVKEMFTQGGKYYNTEIGEYLNDVSNIVSRYQSLNDLDRVATRISKSIPTVEQTLFKSKTEATVNMLQNDLNLFERWVKENGDTMTKADFTNLFRFRTQVKQIYENNIATNLSKKNVEEGKFKNFMGGLYSYIRKSVAQDTYYAYNPETKNIERKHDFNWGTLRREVAQKGVDRQFNSLLVARRAYYDFEYADKLKAEIETIKADLEKQQDELIEMYQKKEGDRNKRDEKAKEVEIAGTKVILQEVESNLADVESLLRNDGWDRRLVTDSYLNNQGLFEKELDMFDKLVAEDILLAKNVGIISQEKYNELKDNKGYAPFKRIIYDEVLGEVDPSEISGNLKLGSKEISSLKKRTGSTKEIIYPLQSAMRNHMEFLNKSVSQDAINTFLTDRTMEMHSANIKKVEWHKGIENQKDIIIKMEDGVRKAYAVDPMIKELLSGYLSPKQVDWLEKVQQSYKQLFTMGTTGTYFPFVFTNLPRDAFNYITQTYQSNSIKAVYNLFADTAKVVLGKNPDNNLELQYFQKYLALGGREMTFVKYMEGDYDAFTTFLRQEEKGLKKIKNTIGKVAKVGLDVLSMPSQLSEMWYRSVEFIEAKKSGDSDVVALEKARRVTTPFHHRGSFKYKDSKGNITNAPNIPKYAPFQNASLQAFAWSGGNFIKDPKIRSRMLLMVGLTTAIGLEEMLRAWKNADDDDKEQFKDLTAEDLSRFIHIPKKGGGIRRIAVAEWAGSIAGTINMAVMDFILEDDVDYSVTDYTTALTTSLPDQFNLLPAVVKLIEKGTWDEFGKWGTSLLPALANPIIAIMGYKTYPEFAPLESSWQKTKLPADRYNEGTSKLAKWAMSLELPFDKGRLGDFFNLSPLQLDAILTQSFGRTIGMITGKPDAWNVLKSVNREYYFEYGRRLNDYWDTKEKNDQLYNSMTKGTREYSKEKELEVFRRKAISKDIDTALDEYKQAYDDKDIERIEKTRARVIDLVTRYNDNPSTPEMEIYLSNPNAKTMEEAMRARALREISMKDPRDYTKEELADAKALAKEFRQEALLARSDYSYSELLFGITKNDDKVVKIEEVIEGKSEAETKKYLASLKYAGMISNDVIIKLYNAGVINYELGKWANDLESNRNF